MAVESLDQSRRQSDSTLPPMFTNFERAAREGEQFRRHPSMASENTTAASPVSPTSYAPPFSSKYHPPMPTNSSQYSQPLTPPESRKNSEDEKRQSLPSLREVGLAPPTHTNGNTYHSHASLPPVHSLPPVQPSPQPHTNGYQHPPPPNHSSEQQRYDYHNGRNEYNSAPAPVHPNPEPYPPRQNSYQQSTTGQYPRPNPPSSHIAFSGPPPPPPPSSGHQFSQPPLSSQSSYPPSSMPPPYGPPYHDSNGNHPPAYSQGSSPTSKVLGKRPSTGYGGAIERALHVSSMRRDLENSRDRSLSIYKLVQHLYEQNGSGYQNHGLDFVLTEFQKAVRDAEELKEGLEGCRRLLTDMCKEQEQQSAAEKGRPHIPEYEVEDHGYPEDPRTVGIQQPELKKVRRGRAAPPGRCHSCHRAETPEWRRGPDGARTLCNACGLHYAKLTRKMSKSNLAATAMARKSPNSSLS